MENNKNALLLNVLNLQFSDGGSDEILRRDSRYQSVVAVIILCIKKDIFPFWNSEVI